MHHPHARPPAPPPSLHPPTRPSAHELLSDPFIKRGAKPSKQLAEQLLHDVPEVGSAEAAKLEGGEVKPMAPYGAGARGARRGRKQETAGASVLPSPTRAASLLPVMDVQQILDEGRALEPKCAVASSPAARALKASLRQMEHWDQVSHIKVYVEADLVNLTRCCLAAGVSPNSLWGKVDTPVLYFASSTGSLRTLTALLDAGAAVGLANGHGWTALHAAASYGKIECVRLLLKAKARLDVVTTLGSTALVGAIESGHAAVVELLLAACPATLHIRSNEGREPLHYAAGTNSPALIDIFLAAGADLEVRDGTGRTPLGIAAYHGCLAAVQHLLERGASVSAVDRSGDTPFVEAIFGRHPAVVQALLPLSDIYAFNVTGRNALHACADTGHEEIFELLLPHVTDLDVGTLPDKTPGHEGDDYGETTLILASSYGRHGMVKQLLRLGASRFAADSRQATALSYASKAGHLSCIALLLGQPGAFRMTPAEIDYVPEDGWTALHDAVQCGHLYGCGLLIQAGARLDAINVDGNTSVEIAQQYQPDNALLLKLLSGNWVGPLPGTTCECCFAVPDSALLHCSGCLSARYCCPRCAAADWPRHAAFCKERRVELEEADRLLLEAY